MEFEGGLKAMSKTRIGSYVLGYTAGTVYVLAQLAMSGVRAHRQQRALSRGN